MVVFKNQLILLLASGLLHQVTAAPIAVADGLDRFDPTSASRLVKRVEEDKNKGKEKARVVSESSRIPRENWATLRADAERIERENAEQAAARAANQARQRQSQPQQNRLGRTIVTLQPEGSSSEGGLQRNPSDVLPIDRGSPTKDQHERMWSDNHPDRWGAHLYKEGPVSRTESTRAQPGNSPPRAQPQSPQGPAAFPGAIRPNPNHPLPPLPEEQPRPPSRSRTSSTSPTMEQQPRPPITASNLQALPGGGTGGSGRTSSQGSAGTTGAVRNVPTNREGQANARNAQSSSTGLVRTDSQRSAGTTGAVRNVPTNELGQANARNAQSSSAGRVRSEVARINAKDAADKAKKSRKGGK